jgi:hypothetical protein
MDHVGKIKKKSSNEIHALRNLILNCPIVSYICSYWFFYFY